MKDLSKWYPQHLFVLLIPFKFPCVLFALHQYYRYLLLYFVSLLKFNLNLFNYIIFYSQYPHSTEDFNQYLVDFQITISESLNTIHLGF